MSSVDSEVGTHGYYFLDLDGNWRFFTPYHAGFRDAISEEIPYPSRTFDWKYKVWVISPDYYDDAMDIAGRFYTMTRVFSVGVGQRRDQRMEDRLLELQAELRTVAQKARVAQEKIADLQVELLQARQTRRAKISDHTGKDCLRAVLKNHPLEALLHILPTAPNEVLRAAYRALSLLKHPDTNRGREKEAVEEQKRINGAFESLSKARGM